MMRTKQPASGTAARGKMNRIKAVLIVMAAACGFGNPSFAQQDLPFCHARQSFGEVFANAFPNSMSIRLPSNPTFPGAYNSATLEMDAKGWALKVQASRPAGGFPKLTALGRASLRLAAPSGAHQVEGRSEFWSTAASKTNPVRFPATDAIKLVFFPPAPVGGFVKLLEKASARGEIVELTAKADGQTVNQYRFKAPDFDKAVKWSEQQMRQVTEMHSVRKCRVLSLF
jgi:hypothetical protein